MFLSFVFFITGLLGFLTFTVVVTQFKTNRKVNFYLLVLFFILSSRFLFNGIYSLIPFAIDEKLGLIFRSFICVVFPCIYLYFKNLIKDKKNLSLGELRYFIVPVLFGFSNILIHQYAPFLHFYFFFLFLGIALFYLFLSYVELKKKLWFRKSRNPFVEKKEVLISDWSYFFFVVCVLMIIRLAVSLLLDVYIAGFSDGITFLWLGAIVSCILFFKVLLAHETLLGYLDVNDEEKKQDCSELVFDDFWILSKNVSINNAQDLKLKERVDESLMTYICEVERMALEHFYFRNPSVTLGDFAVKLGIPKSHLIYFFKYHATISFVGFKRIVKIHDAIRLIEENYLESNSLALLSKKVGFSSCDLFFDNFKEITGVFPKEYNKLMKEI